MHIHRAFEFSAHHISVIERVNFTRGVVPGEIAKAAPVIFFIPTAGPTYRFAPLWSAIPNHGLPVLGLLIFARCQRAGGADEQYRAR